MITFIRSILAVILSILGVGFSGIFGNFNADTTPLKEDCKLNFAVISDIHMTEETARRDMLRFGLEDMEKSTSQLDALVLSGDLTDHGEEAEWEPAEHLECRAEAQGVGGWGSSLGSP